jgi:flagellar hook-associated protein 3 FlgL
MRVDPNYVTNLAGALDQAQANEQQLTSELSSGVSITSLSQNPVASSENVLLLNQIQQDDSFTQSSSLVTGQLQVADSALGSVVTELTSAISAATSANNGTMNSSDIKSVSSQLSGILYEVQGLANTSYQGQYIFAGARRPRLLSLPRLPLRRASRPTTATKTLIILRRRMGRRSS